MSDAPFGWFGGKQRLADAFIRLMPPHKIYVEVFGGGCAVLFAKPRAPMEVYNDLDKRLVNFFTVLRDQPELLQHALELTPYSKAEFKFCREHNMMSEDPVENARRFFVSVGQGFGSNPQQSGWSFSLTPNSRAQKFVDKVDRMMQFADRFRAVQVENEKWEKILDKYDGPDTLFYLDPPYLSYTRKSGQYKHEMSEFGHQRFLKRVNELEGAMLISGYDHKIYRDALEPQFERYEFDVRLLAANQNRMGDEVDEQRFEILWRKTRDEDRLFDVMPSGDLDLDRAAGGYPSAFREPESEDSDKQVERSTDGDSAAKTDENLPHEVLVEEPVVVSQLDLFPK